MNAHRCDPRSDQQCPECHQRQLAHEHKQESASSWVWIVIRDSGGDVEVDVFTNEEAAREHAGFFDDPIVREESVAFESWAHEAVDPE